MFMVVAVILSYQWRCDTTTVVDWAHQNKKQRVGLTRYLFYTFISCLLSTHLATCDVCFYHQILKEFGI